MNEPDKIIDLILYSNIINIFIVIVFFVWLFRKYDLLSFIYKKREGIIETIKNLEHERKIKEHQLDITKNRVKNLDNEVSQIIDDGEQVANTISERIVEEAEKEAANILKKAHSNIENARKVATNEVFQEIATSSFATAEVKIRDAIDERMHKKYIDNFIENLGNIHE